MRLIKKWLVRSEIKKDQLICCLWKKTKTNVDITNTLKILVLAQIPQKLIKCKNTNQPQIWGVDFV